MTRAALIVTCLFLSGVPVLADCPPRPKITPLERDAIDICQEANYEPLNEACRALFKREKEKNLPTEECEKREALERRRAKEAHDLEVVKKATAQ